MIYKSEFIKGFSSHLTFYASTKNKIISFNQGDPPIDSDFAIGGGVPVIINGLKYEEENVYSSNAPKDAAEIGDPGENAKYLLVRSNAGFVKQNGPNVGKTVFAYSSTM